MQTQLKVLTVEDCEDDALLLAREFKRGGLSAEFARVDTAEALRSALQEREWDIVLCDFSMPHFSGMAALHIIRETNPDLPVIFVSGTMGEDVAVEAMRAGANDYLMKDKLKRLVPAVERELRDTVMRVARKRAEEALSATERQLRTLVDNIPDCIVRFDANCRFLLVSPASAKTFGVPPENLVGKTPCEIGMPGDDAQNKALESMIARAFEEGVVNAMETQWSTCDGDRFFDVLHVPERSESGKVVSVLGIAHDITARKLAENALRHSDEEKTILNQIANVFLTMPDEEMYVEGLAIVLRVMKCRFGVFGYLDEKGDLVIPSMTRDVWAQCQVPSKSIVFAAESWGDSLWGKAIRQKETFRSEGPFRTPEGHIPIDCFLTVPIVFGSQTIGLISVANKEGGYGDEDAELLEHIAGYISPILNARLQRDRQERRRIQAEEALRESEQKYRLLVANANEAIFVAQDGVVKFPNTKALELTGYSEEELAEIPFATLIHPEERAAVVERHMEWLEEKGAPETPRFRIIDKQGRQIWTQLTAAQINWEGRPGILCFLRDITEEKKLEAQFLQAQKMEALGQLAGGVSHDFNNLLLVILGYVDILEANLGTDTANSEALGAVRQAAERAADLTRQLLAFSRRQIIQPVDLDVNDLVQGVLKMIRRVIGENIDLCYMPGGRLGAVHADKGQIEQVLMNLCVNARDAMPTGGTLTIETESVVIGDEYFREHPWATEGRYVLLSVTDTGIGMDEATRAQIFEPFFTTKDVGKGTGLGLATVYGIVKQHNGLIHVQSEPGKGAAFKIYFPIAVRPAELVESQTEGRAVGGTETILVAEDEKAVRNLVSHMLATAGYTVLTACDGEDALRVFEEHADAIGLLLLDVMMPKLGGPGVMNHIHARYPEKRFLFSSGYTERAIHTSFVMKEGLRVITKPYRREDLLRTIREILDAPQSVANRQ